MIVLDTNVISELARHPEQRDAAVWAWLAAQPIEELWISSITYAELLAGVLGMPAGRRRQMTLEATQAIVMTELNGRILSFDAAAAIAYAQISAERKGRGLSSRGPDLQIAAIALAHGFTVATRNVADFGAEGLIVLNPWDHPAP